MDEGNREPFEDFVDRDGLLVRWLRLVENDGDRDP